MLTDTTARPLNTTAWTRASLSSFWLWSSGILRHFHELWLKKPQRSGQIVSYLQLCHFPSAAGVAISGNPGSERVWSQNASVSPSNHFWMLLFSCFTVLAGQLVAQTSHKRFLTATLGRKSSMLVSKLLTQLSLVLKPGLFLKSLQRPVSSSPEVNVDQWFVPVKRKRLMTKGREFKALCGRNCGS